MAQNPYVRLGWNPVPGQPGEVEKLRTQLVNSASALQTAYQKIDKLLGESGFWEGDAAVGFREALDGDLPKYMKDAHKSLTAAAGHLGTWHGGLTSRRELAHKYDVEAADQGDLKAANSWHDAAEKDPDLKLAGQTFTEGPELEAAQARLNAANARLSDAVTAVNNAQGALDDVMRKARELEGTHEAEARDLAKKLKDATKDLAPEEPGWLSKALSWIGDNLHQHSQCVGGGGGVAGAVVHGAVRDRDAVGGGCAEPGHDGVQALRPQGESLALGRHHKGRVRCGLLGELGGVRRGSRWCGARCQVPGARCQVPGARCQVPGVGAVSRGLNGAIQSTRYASEAVSAGQFLGRFADDTVTAANRIATAGAYNPVGSGVAQAAGGSQAVKVGMDYVSPVAGVLTSGYGLAAENIDALDSDAGKNTATGVDAARAGLFDGPAAASVLSRTVAALV